MNPLPQTASSRCFSFNSSVYKTKTISCPETPLNLRKQLSVAFFSFTRLHTPLHGCTRSRVQPGCIFGSVSLEVRSQNVDGNLGFTFVFSPKEKFATNEARLNDCMCICGYFPFGKFAWGAKWASVVLSNSCKTRKSC